MNAMTGLLMIFGGTAFAGIVIPLHFKQPGYDPTHQLMSELVFGTYGWAMLIAFSSLALAAANCFIAVRTRDGSTAAQITIMISALTFFGAGIFPLDAASEVHIALVALAFISTVLTMYLLPKELLIGVTIPALPSWSLAAATAISVFLGHSLLPIGIAQRLAGGCVVAWFVWTGWTFAKSALPQQWPSE